MNNTHQLKDLSLQLKEFSTREIEILTALKTNKSRAKFTFIIELDLKCKKYKLNEI